MHIDLTRTRLASRLTCCTAKASQCPKRALALVLESAVEHRRELMEDWNLCARMQMPKKIAPLS